MWNLEGQRIRARYLGQEIQGRVRESRVKYGGSVQHTLELDEPVVLRWRTGPVGHLLVDDTEVVAVVE